MRSLTPTHVVFNGKVGALTGDGAMKANVGESVLFIHSQANRDSRPHLIGGHGDYVWDTGSFADVPATGLETWFIRGGSAGAALYTFHQPGVYVYLSHNLIEAVELGAASHVVRGRRLERRTHEAGQEADSDGLIPARCRRWKKEIRDSFGAMKTTAFISWALLATCLAFGVGSAASWLLSRPASASGGGVNDPLLPDLVAVTLKEASESAPEVARVILVGKHEVTIAGWEQCVAAGACEHRPRKRRYQGADHPVTGVN